MIKKALDNVAVVLGYAAVITLLLLLITAMVGGIMFFLRYVFKL